jgi:hypothetical protein
VAGDGGRHLGRGKGVEGALVDEGAYGTSLGSHRLQQFPIDALHAVEVSQIICRSSSVTMSLEQFTNMPQTARARAEPCRANLMPVRPAALPGHDRDGRQWYVGEKMLEIPSWPGPGNRWCGNIGDGLSECG